MGRVVDEAGDEDCDVPDPTDLEVRAPPECHLQTNVGASSVRHKSSTMSAEEVGDDNPEQVTT